MPSAMSQGVSIHYELSGPKSCPPLVLLRGVGRTLEHWQRAREELEDRFRLVLVDHRGVGRSDPLLGPHTTRHMARDVVAVLDHARIERAHVFGVSLGGMVAQRLAIDYPERVDRLVLGATMPGGRISQSLPLLAVARLTGARLLSPAQSAGIEAEFLLSPRFRAHHPEVIVHWRELAQRFPVSRATIAVQLAAAMRHDASRELGRISAPTLVLSSAQDQLVPPDNSRLLAERIPGAELAWLSGVGHDFATEQPVDTARLLTEFLLS